MSARSVLCVHKRSLGQLVQLRRLHASWVNTVVRQVVPYLMALIYLAPVLRKDLGVPVRARRVQNIYKTTEGWPQRRRGAST